MDDVAQLTTDNRVIAIVTGDCEAEIASLLVAGESFTSEKPAPRALVDIATQSPEVTDQRRRNRQRRLSQQWILLLQILVLDDISQRGRGADARTVAIHADLIQSGHRRKIDQRIRQRHALAGDPILHDAANQVAATADDPGRW